jgi:hypothetical protein
MAMGNGLTCKRGAPGPGEALPSPEPVLPCPLKVATTAAAEPVTLVMTIEATGETLRLINQPIPKPVVPTVRTEYRNERTGEPVSDIVTSS